MRFSTLGAIATMQNLRQAKLHTSITPQQGNVAHTAAPTRVATEHPRKVATRSHNSATTVACTQLHLQLVAMDASNRPTCMDVIPRPTLPLSLRHMRLTQTRTYVARPQQAGKQTKPKCDYLRRAFLIVSDQAHAAIMYSRQNTQR
jgi:hypothetical protein